MFLGLLLHAKHSWLPHIKEIKAKCLRTLNIIKYLAHPITGYNKETLLSLYHALVRSVLDYGSPSLFDPIQNAVIRVCTGAFHASPSSSLCANSGYLPLHYRRLTLTANLLSSIVLFPNSPIHCALFNLTIHIPLTHAYSPKKIIRKKYSFLLPHFHPAGHPTMLLFLTRS